MRTGGDHGRRLSSGERLELRAGSSRTAVWTPRRRETPRKALLAHQPGGALAADADVVGKPQLGLDPRRAVRAAAVVVDLPDAVAKDLVGERAQQLDRVGAVYDASRHLSPMSRHITPAEGVGFEPTKPRRT